MVRDNHVHAQVYCQAHFTVGGDATVNGDQRRYTRFFKNLDCLKVQAMPFVHAMGYIGSHFGSQAFQALSQKGRGRYAVNVEVPEDSYGLA